MPILPVASYGRPRFPRRAGRSRPARRRNDPTPEVDQLGVMQAARIAANFAVELTPGEGLVVGDEYLAEG